MSRVSCAMRRCLNSGSDAIVRMLWSRSASLMSRTRMSFAIATSILRSVAACCASLESNWRRSSLVTPSTMVATSAPELALDVLLGDGRVLDRVVQERGGDGDVVEAEIGEHQRHPDRVGDVGLPRAPDLLAVGVAGDVEGVLDHGGVAAAVPLEVGVDERGELGVDGVGPPPGQHGATVGANLDTGSASGQIRRAHLRDNSTGGPGVPRPSPAPDGSAALAASLLATTRVGGAPRRCSRSPAAVPPTA